MNIHLPSPTVRILPSIGPADADRIRRLFDRSLSLDEQDDRFDQWPSATSELFTTSIDVWSAVATGDDEILGYIGGPIDQGRAELDAIVDPQSDDPSLVLDALLDALMPELKVAGAIAAQVWGRPSRPWHESVAEGRSGTQSRALHQMRCRLPVEIPAIDSRDYRPEHDLDALREVNNRAFVTHPDQGNQTNQSLLATMAEPWFRPEGIRIHERDGRVAGFCWTKIHPSRSSFTRPSEKSPPLGEIYVIGVDPDFHGQGLGAPMTAAGLQWMYEQGLEVGMLYVEADNVPAVRTYERLGFTVLRTDRAWSIPLDAS